MKDIEGLLKKLHGMEPISKEFRSDLSCLLSKHKKTDQHTFLKQGQIARKIWHLLSGFIITSRKDSYGHQMVTDIYGPGALVTDFISFLNQDCVNLEFSAIGNVEVLQLKYADYQKLLLYPEMGRLTQTVTLGELKMSKAKSDLYALPDKSRIIRLFNDYQISGLPDKYCASFLHLSLEKYLELKVPLLKSGQIKLSAVKPSPNIQGDHLQKVCEVKAYLIEHYRHPEIDNVIKIATLFHTTKKTLTLNFRKVLGTTVHKLILKLRMDRAYVLLSCHKIPIREVYLEVGYKDVYYFCKLFKAYHGVSAKAVIERKLS